MLVFGSMFLISGFASHHSSQWLSDPLYKHRDLDRAWAAAALAIGIGVVPLIAGLAALAPARGAPVAA